MTTPGPAVAVVVVTHNEAEAPRALAAISEQLREDDELIVVDNASDDQTVAAVRAAAPGARVLEQRDNLGFPAAVNVGVDASSAPLLLLLNPDAVPAPGSIDLLRATALGRPDWGAWQAVVTLPGGGAINTSGGITHFLGVGWAGRLGQPVESAPPEPHEVSFASGAALMVRRETWERAGGMEGRFFLYVDDLDLSLRVWLAGERVGVVPAARVEHDYDFQSRPHKWYYLERNRWWMLLGAYPPALLALLAPALLAFELVLLIVAARGGWLGQKLRAQAAVARELPAILARRGEVQRRRRIGSVAFARHLTAELDSPYLPDAARVGPLVALQRGYWAAVRGLLSAGGAGRGC